ncbi:MAG TPA: helix-turn-helix domain-containing protein [Candidatus Paceibacterota bacterium]|nr:helix-turn-helix domain-containing protein [Candidatus Paceibacterota bacterium]
MINELLSRIGFSEKEIQVYLCVLENGKIAPAAVASLTNIKRPTVYAVAKELIKKGAITEDLQGTSAYLLALPPEELMHAFENEERAIMEKKKAIKSLAKELESIPRSKSYSVPKMRFIDEYSLKDFLYRQTPVWHENMVRTGNTTYWGFQDHTLVENKEYQEWIDFWWKTAPKEIDLKLISNDSAIEEQMKEKRYDRRIIKFWKKDLKFSASNHVVGDYVLFIMTKQRPHYLVEIHDAVYAENLRQLFKNLWEMIEAKEGERNVPGGMQ